MAKVKETVDTASICELVRDAETNYLSGGSQIGKYVHQDFYDDVNKIQAYLESKHTSGEFDSQGREKPFFNIVIASRNIWYRATDIDRKNMILKASKSADVLPAFLATQINQDWMRRENFGLFLNEWGLELAGYLSCIVKFVEKDGRLIPMVMPWSKMIVDYIDFDSNIKIEILELTEAQLRKRKEYDQDMVERLCDAVTARYTLDGAQKDNKPGYIKLYEVHGLLPKSLLTGNDNDEDIYVDQMHVISFVEGKGEGEFDDFSLYSGREEKCPYMLTSLMPNADGSISLNGSVKNLFEAQWMVNHSVKTIKDQLDLASKLVFQTSDGNFIGQNVLFDLQNGDILIHQLNQPLTQLNNNSHDIVANTTFKDMWKQLSNEINGISEAMLGINPKSGTAWRQTQALLQESHSLFDMMTQNKALDVERMFREYIIPFHKKKLNHTNEIAAILEANDIDKIDSKYIRNVSVKEYNRLLVDAVIQAGENGGEIEPPDLAGIQSNIQGQLNESGNTRFFKPSDIPGKTWKMVLKGLEWTLVCDFAGEATDKEDLQTLTTVFQTIADPVKQAVLKTPEGKMLFNKILTMTAAVSPLEISNTPSPMQPQPLSASVGGGGGGGLTA